MYKALFNMLIEAYSLCSFTYYLCFKKKKTYSLDAEKKTGKQRKSYYPYFLYF